MGEEEDEWVERFNAFFAAYLRDRVPGYANIEAVKEIRQDTRRSFGCETCAFDYEVIDFMYREDGLWLYGEIEASFAELFGLDV